MDNFTLRELSYIEQSINTNILCLEDFQPIDYKKQIEDLTELLKKIKLLQSEKRNGSK